MDQLQDNLFSSHRLLIVVYVVTQILFFVLLSLNLLMKVPFYYYIYLYLCFLDQAMFLVTVFSIMSCAIAEGARAALNLSGTMLGFYPVKVLPSKTAIAPVDPKFLPRVRNTGSFSARPSLARIAPDT